MLLSCLAALGLAQQMENRESGEGSASGSDDRSTAAPAAAEAAPIRTLAAAPAGVEWTGLARTSIRFVGLMHAFRWATEPGTRSGGIGLGRGYRRSVRNLHG